MIGKKGSKDQSRVLSKVLEKELIKAIESLTAEEVMQGLTAKGGVLISPISSGLTA